MSSPGPAVCPKLMCAAAYKLACREQLFFSDWAVLRTRSWEHQWRTPDYYLGELINLVGMYCICFGP